MPKMPMKKGMLPKVKMPPGDMGKMPMPMHEEMSKDMKKKMGEKK